MSRLGKYINEYRIQNGNMSIRGLALKCDLSSGYIHKLEKGVDPRTKKPIIPTVETINKLSKGMNVSVDILLELSGIVLDLDATRINKNGNTEDSTLTKKDEKDIAKDLENTLNRLEGAQDGLMFDGEALDDETRELLKISLENSMRLAKQIAKKYTPKKYKK